MGLVDCMGDVAGVKGTQHHVDGDKRHGAEPLLEAGEVVLAAEA